MGAHSSLMGCSKEAQAQYNAHNEKFPFIDTDSFHSLLDLYNPS